MRCSLSAALVLVGFALGLSGGTDVQAQTFGEDIVASFGASAPEGNQPSNLIQASDGNFYGTMYAGGAGGSGSIYKVTPAGAATVLYTFCNTLPCTEGNSPYFAPLVQASDGFLYGTTFAGGLNGAGTFYRISLTGTLTTLHNFCEKGGGACTDGGLPYEALIQGTDGDFYGSTIDGGKNGTGNLFKVTDAGDYTDLYDLPATDAGASALVQGSDGNFYGTIYSGAGPQANGFVFQLTPAGAFKSVYNFCQKGGADCTDGALPGNGVIEGADGDFYGTTSGGGNDDYCGANNQGGGTLYKVTSAGVLTTLYEFCSKADGADGIGPQQPPVLGSDGAYYGVTFAGGNSTLSGTFYRWNGSTLSTLFDYCQTGSCTGGVAQPYLSVQGADGAFYGNSDYYQDVQDDPAVFKMVNLAGLAAPVQLSLSSSSVTPGATFTLSYKVINATSDTMKQCFALNNANVAAWTGVKTATPSTQTVTLTAPETTALYTFSLTCGGVESSNIQLDVKAGSKVNTSTVFTSTPNPAGVGTTLALAATVKPASGTLRPGGNVTFSFGSFQLGVAGINGSGVATLSQSTTGLPTGTFTLTASYPGDGNFNASAGNASVTLVGSNTATTLTPTPNPVTPPTNLTLTAAVKRTSGPSGTATGSVTFYYSTIALANATLNGSGVASYVIPTSSLPAGSYPLSVKYNGDANDAPSTSSAVTVTVK